VQQPTQEQVEDAWKFVHSLEKDYGPRVEEVTKGKFVRGFLEGTYPLEGMQFWTLTHYHLINNDIKNLAKYVTKARDEEEVQFFLFMTIAETRMLEALYVLWEALGRKKAELPATEPYALAMARSNYFSVLALYATPGEIALAILLNFPLWANGARRVSKGLKKHYGLGKNVPGSRKRDTDLLDRFSHATQGFRNMAVRIIAKDLSEESERSMRRVGRLSVETEANVWEQYSNYAGRMGLKMRQKKK
jgi:thiaminase